MSPHSFHRIGIDGGGTKTELILCDSAGTIVARHSAPGCNPSHAGAEGARTLLLAAIQELLAAAGAHRPAPGGIKRTHLYMAGARAVWQEIAAALRDCGEVTAGDDSLPVLELATGGGPGLVLHAGTGSFIAARAPDGSVHYGGGLGWKFGDPGSGFELGRRGIARALLELQGWAATTALARALQVHTGLDEAGAISRYFYNDPAANARIAAFAPVVLEQAAAGCAPAQAALAATLTELLDQAGLVLTKLFPDSPAAPTRSPGSATQAAEVSGPSSSSKSLSQIENQKSKIPLGVSGAILNRPPVSARLRELVAGRDWPVELRFITEPPIEGVRRLLLKS